MPKISALMPKLLPCVLLLTVVSSVAAAQVVRTAETAGPALFPGDAVKVTIWQEPDLSGTFRVDENDVLTLPLLGARSVAGLSADELRNRLLQDYAVHLKNPAIEVVVLRRVSVLGEVAKPGLYDLEPSMRVGDVIALAGGVTEQGNPEDVEFFRGGGKVGENLEMGGVIGDRVRAGDQIVVQQRSWLSRNGDRVLLTVGMAVTGILIRSAF